MPRDDQFLQIYLQHHWVGSTGGRDLFDRAASSHSDARAREQLATLAREVTEDRQALRDIADRFGVREARVQQAAARIGEYLGRFKPNGALKGRSPLSDLVELEALSLGVEGKKRCWLTLLTRAENEPRLDAAQLEELLRRADQQLDVLASLHREAAARI
ncbi:hypothetical protein M3C61_05895 [Dermacoccus abyssi]|uniref:hypothetical protein n=1 Tax=Dermacoccus abyssi TaxID=322596 RepID=UPI0021A62303|nr:hypothetical protein [Dermacoccus abyssi]MCT1986558.1 hypothetical protein [Dermacoccus abyssi]